MGTSVKTFPWGREAQPQPAPERGAIGKPASGPTCPLPPFRLTNRLPSSCDEFNSLLVANASPGPSNACNFNSGQVDGPRAEWVAAVGNF